MKAEFNIDFTQLAIEITREVIKALKPLMVDRDRVVTDTVFTVETLAEYLGVSKQWIYERVRRKEIPFIKVGKFPRFREAEIETWLDSQRIPATQPFSKRVHLVK